MQPAPVNVNTDDTAVIAEMHRMNLHGILMAKAPRTGVVIMPVICALGVRVFLGRFHDGQSLGWLSYTIVGANSASPEVRFVMERICDTYPQAAIRSSLEVSGTGTW